MKSQIANFIKIRPVGAEVFNADRQTDGRKEGHDEANSRFFSIFRTSLTNTRRIK